MRLFSVVCLLILTTVLAVAEEASNTSVQSKYLHKGEKYPPVFIQHNMSDNFLDILKSYDAFEDIDENAVGMPIGVRVLKAIRTKRDAKSSTSALLSASTLGLIPVLSNSSFKVRYDVFIQGDSIAKFEYEMTTSEVNNIMWGGSLNRSEMKPEEEIFLEASLSKFLTDVKNNEEIQKYFNEYFYYFKQ